MIKWESAAYLKCPISRTSVFLYKILKKKNKNKNLNVFCENNFFSILAADWRILAVSEIGLAKQFRPWSSYNCSHAFFQSIFFMHFFWKKKLCFSMISQYWFNTYLFAKSNWKQIESILISISKSWKGWTHVAYYYKHSKSLGDIFCGCDMIPLHKRRSGVNFLSQMMTCRFSSQLRKKELILPIGL